MDFYESDKVIQLGTGVEFMLLPHLLSFHYVPFSNVPGGMIMLGVNVIGLSANTLSIITGGTLTPIDA